MKKNATLSLCVILMIVMSGCMKRLAPPYSTVEKIVRVTPGMSASEVSSTLGIPPYDVYHMAGDGSSVMSYWYKLKERKNTGCGTFEKMGLADPFYSKEENLSVGASYYTSEHKLYVLYQNGKVSSLVTDAGQAESEELLILNNTIQFIGKTNRHAFNYYNYEKLELGQQLIRLDHKGEFVKSTGIFGGNNGGGAKKLKKGCKPKGCGQGCGRK